MQQPLKNLQQPQPLVAPSPLLPQQLALVVTLLQQQGSQTAQQAARVLTARVPQAQMLQGQRQRRRQEQARQVQAREAAALQKGKTSGSG